MIRLNNAPAMVLNGTNEADDKHIKLPVEAVDHE